MTSSITYNLVTLTIEGATSFLQLRYVQNVRKNMRYSMGNSKALFNMTESLRLKDPFKFLIFFFVLEPIGINSSWQ